MGGVDDFSSGMASLKQLYDLPRSAFAAVSRQRICALYISHALRDAAPNGGKPVAFQLKLCNTSVTARLAVGFQG